MWQGFLLKADVSPQVIYWQHWLLQAVQTRLVFTSRLCERGRDEHRAQIPLHSLVSVLVDKCPEVKLRVEMVTLPPVMGFEFGSQTRALMKSQSLAGECPGASNIRL